jgi:hydrogenase maturation factor HypF (carbamoyltransferase family)
MKLCNCGEKVTAKDKRNKDGLQNKCNSCYNQIRNKRYKDNPNPIKQRQKKYNDYQLQKQKEHIKLISDTYVIAELKRGTILTTKDIRKFPELIETKRQIIKNKRLCKSKI